MCVRDTSEADAADGEMVGVVDGWEGANQGWQKKEVRKSVRESERRSALLGSGCLGWHAVSC